MAVLVCGCGAVLLAVPTAASASGCPSLAGIKAFAGTASTSFSGTASGADNSGGTQSVSLHRTATGLQLNMPYGATGVATVYGAHPGVSPSGGSINVSDQSTDNNPAGNTSGSDTGGGPTVSEGSAATLNFFTGSCTYQLAVEWSIDTTQSVTGQPPAADSASGYGQTGLISIPASLKLSGSITVPVYGSGPDCTKKQTQFMGCYGNNGGFASQYAGLYGPGQPEGTATITWNLSPSGPQSCPVGGGGTITSAAAHRRARIAARYRPARVGWRGRSLTSAERDPHARVAEATCGENACCVEKTREETKADAKEAARQFRNTTYITGALGVVTGAFFKPFGVIFGLVTIGAKYASDHASDVAANDPRVPNWRSIVKARRIGLVRAPATGFLGSAGTAALNAILRQMATVNGLESAEVVSYDREGSAKAAHNSVWSKRQAAAVGRFAVQAAQAINRLVKLIQQSKSTLSVPFPGLGPSALERAAGYVRAHGLPKSFVRLAKSHGLPASLLDAIKRKVESAAPLPTYATSMYGILSNPALISAEEAYASALLAYGQSLLATG